MRDTHIVKLAKVLVCYSLALKEGDVFLISAPASAEPLVREVYREALLEGAHPLLRISIESIEDLLYKYGTEAQIRFLPELLNQEIEQIDAMLSISATENTKRLTNTDPQKVALRRSATQQVFQRLVKRVAANEVKWTATLFPTSAAAQDADMSLAEYEDFVYSACKLDIENPVGAWQALRAEQQQIADFLSTKHVIHLIAPDTDITYHTAGRTWINAAGERNFPDGEVFTSPEETKTQGYIRFTYPAVYMGNEVEDVRLVFEEGKVVQATAKKGEALLQSLLDMDEGARRLGESAFGLNYDIQRFTRNTLFDEKIGGTVHLALGLGFEVVGGRNRSALHWDMVCDMRQGSSVYADGQLIYKDGNFII